MAEHSPIFDDGLCTDETCIFCFDDSLHMRRCDIEAWLQLHGVIPVGRTCTSCQAPMEYQWDKAEYRCHQTLAKSGFEDGVRRCCNTYSCESFGTFFEGKYFNRKTFFRYVAYWLWLPYPRHQVLKNSFQMTPREILCWSGFCREVCIDYMISNSQQIGGLGRVVELYEAKIGTRKYNKGRIINGDRLFGGIDRKTNDSFLVPAQSGGADILLRIIETYVLPGSHIVSDCWAKYETHSHLSFIHLTESCTYSFLSSEGRTRKVDRIWWEVRGSVPRIGCKSPHLDGYIAEFFFRRKFDLESRLHGFWKAVATVYPSTHTWNESFNLSDQSDESDSQLDEYDLQSYEDD